MTFVKCVDSPWGPVELAIVGIGCRSGIRPRFMVQSVFANTVEIVEALRERCGYPAQLAEVRTQIYYDRVISKVVQDGRASLEIQTTGLSVLTGSGASVLYSPSLSMNEVGDKRRLVQVDWSADFERVGRGAPKIEVFDGDTLIGGDFTPTDPISATLARATVVLHKPVYALDPIVLPGDGGVDRLVAKA
jgi:hypothetical protein